MLKKSNKEAIDKLFFSIDQNLKRSREIYEDFEDESSSLIIQGRTRKRARSYTRLIKRDSMVSGRSNTSTPRSLNLSRNILPTPDKSDISPLGIDPSTPVLKKQKLSHTPRVESPGTEKRNDVIERLSLTSSPVYGSPEIQVNKMSGKDFLSHLRPSKRANNRARKVNKLMQANPEMTEEEISSLLVKHADYLATKIAEGDLKIRPGELTEIDMKAFDAKYKAILKKSEEVLRRTPVSPNEPPRKKRKIFDGSA